MHRAAARLMLSAAAVALLPAQDVVFRSDVSLVRVDAQVLDRDNRAITGLRRTDFVLREDGRPQEIRNFAAEKMPVDVLVLVDVSGSMRPHVQRLTAAARQAVTVLYDNDRTALMVFDRSSRVRMPFRSGRQSLPGELDLLLSQESFNGGTDITRALLDAAAYVRSHARAEARRAIVILTDDQTERERDEAAVSRALIRADTVLSALIAPNASRYSQQRGGGMGGPRQGGGTWPGQSGGGVGVGGPLGDIILGRRGTYGGRQPGGGVPGGQPGGQPGGVTIGGGTRPAGTSEIARRSGGDSMSIDDADSFENTLSRIRNRYALYFYLPEGVRPGEERDIEVDLVAATRRHYPDAEVRYRRTYMAPEGSGAPANPDPPVITRAPSRPSGPPAGERRDPDAPRLSRRPPADPVPIPADPEAAAPAPESAPATSAAAPADASTAPNRGTWRKQGEPPPAEESTAPNRGGWRKLKPGEQP